MRVRKSWKCGGKKARRIVKIDPRKTDFEMLSYCAVKTQLCTRMQVWDGLHQYLRKMMQETGATPQEIATNYVNMSGDIDLMVESIKNAKNSEKEAPSENPYKSCSLEND